MHMRMTGAGVSQDCDGELTAVRDDMQLVQEHAVCEQEGGYLPRIASALEQGDLSGAVSVMAEDLHTCTKGKISETCADQLAPPVLQLLIAQAAAQASQQPQVDMIVFAETAKMV